MTMSDPSFLIFPIYAAGLIVLLAGEFYQRRSFFPKKEDAMPIYAFSLTIVEEAATPEEAWKIAQESKPTSWAAGATLSDAAVESLSMREGALHLAGRVPEYEILTGKFDEEDEETEALREQTPF